MDARFRRYDLRRRHDRTCAVHRRPFAGILIRAGTRSGHEEEASSSHCMTTSIDQILRETPSFRRLSAEDRQRVAGVARLATYVKGDTIFAEAEPSDHFYSVA